MASFEYDGDGGRKTKTTYVIASENAVGGGGIGFGDLLNEEEQENVAAVLGNRAPQVTTYVGSMYEETDGVATCFIFLGSQRIGSVSRGRVSYFHADHLGGTNVVSDRLGEVVEVTEYEPYGKIARRDRYRSGEDTAWYYFTGQKYDDETGLYFYNARYYDPEIGRFITADTIVQDPSNPQTLNRYTYVGNNPVNYVDPSGHSFFGIDILVGALIGACIGGVSSAILGNDIGEGILTGAIGGAIFGGIGALKFSGTDQIIAHSLGGAASGGINATILDADVAESILVGGISAGVSQLAGQKLPFLSASGEGFTELSGAFVGRVIIGAVLGGTAAEASGGSFSDGAEAGAVTTGIAFLANEVQHKRKRSATKKHLSKTQKSLKEALKVVGIGQHQLGGKTARLIGATGTAAAGFTIAAGTGTAVVGVAGASLLVVGLIGIIDSGIDLSGYQHLGPDQAAFESLGLPGGEYLDAVIDIYGISKGGFENLPKSLETISNGINAINNL